MSNAPIPPVPPNADSETTPSKVSEPYTLKLPTYDNSDQSPEPLCAIPPRDTSEDATAEKFDNAAFDSAKWG